MELVATASDATSSATSPHGDTLSISNVQLGTPDALGWTSPYHNSTDWIDCNGLPQVHLGDRIASCALETFNDTIAGTTQTPPNNHSTDAYYDACGNLVATSTMVNWALVQNPAGFPSNHYIGGQTFTLVGDNEPIQCYGTWTVAYSLTMTFADGDALTVSASSNFQVPAQNVLPVETQGAGNQAENQCSTCAGDPVDTSTGDYAEPATDLALAGRGPQLAMTRTYSSLEAVAGDASVVGPGWSFNYGMSLAIDPATGNATITNGNGSQTAFTKALDAAGNPYFTQPARVFATLTANADGTYTYTVRARTIYTFDSQGRLTSVADLNGYKVTLTYAGGQLATATDASGHTLQFAYGGDGHLSSVTDSSGRKVSYGHDAAGNLTSVTDVRNGNSAYTYDGSHLMLTRKDANGNVVMTNTYDSHGRALTQIDGLNHTTTFSYNAYPSTATQVTDPNANVTEYDYVNGMLTRMTRAAGTSAAATWKYLPDAAGSGSPLEITDRTVAHGATATARSAIVLLSPIRSGTA